MEFYAKGQAQTYQDNRNYFWIWCFWIKTWKLASTNLGGGVLTDRVGLRVKR